MTADGWLQAHLVAIGAANPDGVSRAARATTCGDCGRRVLRGLDGDRCALVATADLHEIDHVGEYLAKRIGLHTYSIRYGLVSKKGAWTLDPRYPCEIEAGIKTPVVAQHRCGIAIPPANRTWAPMWRAPRPRSSEPDF